MFTFTIKVEMVIKVLLRIGRPVTLLLSRLNHDKGKYSTIPLKESWTQASTLVMNRDGNTNHYSIHCAHVCHALPLIQEYSTVIS